MGSTTMIITTVVVVVWFHAILTNIRVGTLGGIVVIVILVDCGTINSYTILASPRPLSYDRFVSIHTINKLNGLVGDWMHERSICHMNTVVKIHCLGLILYGFFLVWWADTMHGGDSNTVGSLRRKMHDCCCW